MGDEELQPPIEDTVLEHENGNWADFGWDAKDGNIASTQAKGLEQILDKVGPQDNGDHHHGQQRAREEEHCEWREVEDPRHEHRQHVYAEAEQGLLPAQGATTNAVLGSEGFPFP